MTLEELRPLVQTPPKITGGLWGFGTYWSPLILTKHARRVWDGKAYVATDALGEIRIYGNGTAAQYACSFEDLMANDWEVVS